MIQATEYVQFTEQFEMQVIQEKKLILTQGRVAKEETIKAEIEVEVAF